MGLFFYTKKGSIISTVDLPTTEIIEPKKKEKEFENGIFFHVNTSKNAQILPINTLTK